jgi:hypothetical protein
MRPLPVQLRSQLFLPGAQQWHITLHLPVAGALDTMIRATANAAVAIASALDRYFPAATTRMPRSRYCAQSGMHSAFDHERKILRG